MPIGVPRIIYCWGEELPAQWTDIYNFIFRRRMVFLMQYLDDELCNQICGLLINIHMEDRSKELEKKEMERSGVFKNSSSSTSQQSKNALSSRLKTSGDSEQKGIDGLSDVSNSFYNKKSRSMEDLLNADEDLGIDEIDTLEQYTLQKITTEWLNWNAQFFDYTDEPYLYYLADLLSKDFNKSQNNVSTFSSNTGENMYTEISKLLTILKNQNDNSSVVNGSNFAGELTQNSDFFEKATKKSEAFKNKANMQMGEVYSAFRTNTNFSSYTNNLKPGMLLTNNKKQKLLQMFQEYQNISNIFAKKDSNKTVFNLLSKLAQKDFSSKLQSFQNFEETSEKILSQKNLRRAFSKENNFSLLGVDNLSSNYGKSFNYINTGNKQNVQSEFRDYYRKQTERALIEEESKKVFVIINSFGGSVGNGITVHDALQFIKAGSLTLALGVAASAASLALAGGTIGERYVTEGCHVMIHQPECLTPDHKVLTSRGWIPIADVTLQDKVAVLDNQTGEMSYQNAEKVHKYEYEGPMYEVKTTGIDLFVTPNHRMYVNTTDSSRKQNYNLIEASSIYRKKVRYKNNAIWNKPDYQFILPAVVKLTRHENSVINITSMQPDMEAWLTFFGLWVSEGHTSKILRKTEENQQQDSQAKAKKQRHMVYITQVKENVCLIIEETLNKLGFHYVRHGKNYEIQNKQLWSYLNPLDKGALNKYLPDWVWELSSKQCQILLNSLCLGDGHFNKNDETVHYFSGSEQLANDVSRLALHAGAAATIQLETAPSRPSRTIRGEPIRVNNPLWRVNILKSRFYPYANYKSSTVNLSNNVVLFEPNYKKFLNSSLLTVASANVFVESNAQSTKNSTLLTTEQQIKTLNNYILTNKSCVNTTQDTTLVTLNSYKHTQLDEEIPTSELEIDKVEANDRFVYYKGPVYCLTVPNSVFYVQRNGKPLWTGNSSLQGQASDIWIDSQEIMKIRLDVAEIYSLSTYRPRHKILRDLDRDFYLTATETIQYGLADEIASNDVMHDIIEMTNKVWDYHDSKQQRLLESRESASSGLDTQTQN